MGGDRLANEIAGSVTHDEIGLAYGHFDGHLLRSAYQPAYRLQSGKLKLVGARGLVRPSRGGRPLQPVRLFDRLEAEDRHFLECLCRALHVGNLPHLDLDTGSLALSLGAEDRDRLALSLGLLRDGVEELQQEGFDAPRIWCEVTSCRTEDAAAAAEAIRAHGFRVAIAGFGPDALGVALAETMAPDYVRLDGAWFRTVVRAPGAVALMANLADMLRRKGIEVMADGIETPSQFEAALDIGADLFQGYLFAPPFPAGTSFAPRPLRLPELLRRGAKIIPLRRPA